MQRERYTLEHIKETQFGSWTEFYESLQEEDLENPKAVVSYKTKEGELREIELPFRQEDIKFLAYYEALDEIKSMGLSSFHEFGQYLEKNWKGTEKEYQHYYVTRGEGNMIEMHALRYPVERIAKFAQVEKEELMKFAEPPRTGSHSFK
jgi:hypothetical protein